MSRALNVRTGALLRRLVRRDAAAALRKLLQRHRPEDIAAAMTHMTWAEQRRLIQSISDPEYAAGILAHLREDSTREVTREMTEEQVVALIERMEPDDATDMVAALRPDLRTRVLDEMDDEEVRSLLEWPADTAGGLMSTAMFRMPDTATCGQAIAALQRESEDLETIYYVYVVDRDGALVGVSSLRSLLVAAPRTPLIRVMASEVITVGPMEDQEEVARFVARYDLLAIPVVDKAGVLLGVVTVDDVVDVIRDEAAEDMMLMVGVRQEEPQGTVLRHSSQRAGWLLATIVGGILAAEIIASYEHTLAQVAVLAGFIPVIMGMGGNVGIQSATLAVRGLATGHIQLGGAGQFLVREARVGIVLGLLYALLIGAYGALRFVDEPMIAVSVATSIFLAISLAGVVGASIPIGLSRVGIDPAIATGPFVTTIVDVLGIVIYFTVARSLLGL